jgi:polysaccharide deacetylase 2 family uncharacterized protein YibQ
MESFAPAPSAPVLYASDAVQARGDAPAELNDEDSFPPAQAAAQAGLAIVMDDMGEDMQAVRTLLGLRIPIAFAVWPHARYAQETALAAYDAACVVLIHQPMEAIGASAKPGRGALRVGVSRERLEAVFRQSLARVPYAEGLNNHMGSRFTSRLWDVRLFCEIMADSGLFVLDSVTHPGSVLYEEALAAGIPAARRDVFLDAKPGKAAVLTRLREAERLALRGKQIIAVGHPRADTLAALREWNSTRNPEVRLLSLRDCLTLPEPGPTP